MKKLCDLRLAAGVYGGVALVLSILSAALRCVSLSFFFDADIGYFQSGAVLPLVANGILVASALFFAVASFLLFRGSEPAPAGAPSLPLRIASALVAIAFLYVAAMNILGISGSVWSGILSLGAGLYFATLLSKKPLPPLFRLLCATCAIARLFIVMAIAYRDVTVQMNAPLKLTLQMACIAGMLMIVCDLKARTMTARPVLYPFSLACGALFTGLYAIPYVIDVRRLSLGGVHDPILYGDAYALLALFLFAAVSLLELGKSPKQTERATLAEEPAQKEATDETDASDDPTEPAEDSDPSTPSPEQEA